MRSQGIGDISEIYYGILEQNGTLSLLKNDDKPLAHSLIIDGQKMTKKLKALGLNEKWLDKKLCEKGLTSEEIFLMTVTDEGDVNIIKREKR